MRDKAVNSIQMAIRAGKTVRGDGLLTSIQNGKAKLVVYSSKIGMNSKKKILNKSATAGIPAHELDYLRFNAISDKPAAAYSITDAGFAGAILKNLGASPDPDAKPETEENEPARTGSGGRF